MIIEILYSEVASLYGERGNIQYLQLCLPEATFVFTPLASQPAFVSQDVKFIYMGPTSERYQKIIIEKLRPFTARIQTLIDQGVFFLLTGNAVDVFGEKITYTKDDVVEGLHIYDAHAVLDYLHRFNCLMLGEHRDFEIVGHKTQFTMSNGNNSNQYFMKVKKGIGLNRQSTLEGFWINNLIATHMVGPILILNPLFTQDLLTRLLNRPVELPFFDQLLIAYQKRLVEFKGSKRFEF